MLQIKYGTSLKINSDIENENLDQVQVEIKQLASGNYTFEIAHKILAKVLRIINTHKQDVNQLTVLTDTIEILLKTMIQIAVFDIYLIQSKKKKLMKIRSLVRNYQ